MHRYNLITLRTKEFYKKSRQTTRTQRAGAQKTNKSKSDLAKGGAGLLFATKDKSRPLINEYKAFQTWMSGIMSGRYSNDKIFDMLVMNVHIPSAVIRRTKSKDEIFGFAQIENY
ncbi:hypothetical protein AYI68_g6371 [Smittium mucronatum]|uniref:Uncharacterized protein n=1 Tax=Smittium mucronatum TaxID=133383 RepID=A0A1R0GRQ1_9FUNG|nr:hypothetical protein AYI68_g6371 [Smittium mucronatum]